MSSTVLDPEDAVVGKKAPSLLSQGLQFVGEVDSCQVIIQIIPHNCDRCFVEVHVANKGT